MLRRSFPRKHLMLVYLIMWTSSQVRKHSGSTDCLCKCSRGISTINSDLCWSVLFTHQMIPPCCVSLWESLCDGEGEEGHPCLPLVDKDDLLLMLLNAVHTLFTWRAEDLDTNTAGVKDTVTSASPGWKLHANKINVERWKPLAGGPVELHSRARWISWSQSASAPLIRTFWSVRSVMVSLIAGSSHLSSNDLDDSVQQTSFLWLDSLFLVYGSYYRCNKTGNIQTSFNH